MELGGNGKEKAEKRRSRATDPEGDTDGRRFSSKKERERQSLLLGDEIRERAEKGIWA